MQGPVDGAVPAELVARWRRAEEQLYAGALGTGGRYERSVELVRRTVEHLRRLGAGPGPLLAHGEDAAGLVRTALSGTPDTPVELDLELDLDLVGRAALALRHREVVAEDVAGRRVATLRAAREAGAGWVVLEESGDPAGSPLSPYRRLEADPRTGRAVLVTTAPDPSWAASRHAAEALLVDLATGALQELHGPRAGGTDCTDPAERERRAAALRAELSR